MKKCVCVILSVLLLLSFPVAVNAETDSEPSISAEAYILYCADNGQIINSKNENKKMKPASTTKIMTSLIALEESASGHIYRRDDC